MPLNLASPGIVVREVDLTQGRIDSSTNKTGGMVGAFAQGPVELPTLVGNENDLLMQDVNNLINSNNSANFKP